MTNRKKFRAIRHALVYLERDEHVWMNSIAMFLEFVLTPEEQCNLAFRLHSRFPAFAESVIMPNG